MLGIVRKSAADLPDWLATESGFISGLLNYDGEPIVLEPYQMAFLDNHSRFRWVSKSRQVGYSFIVAMEALARCHLRDGHTSIFVSYNLDDAKEKILTARQTYEEMLTAYQKRLVVDSKTELAFESGRKSGRVSRILSVPSKAPRGKKGDIVLDELAHYVNDRQVYTGSTALILRSNGQLTGCSTPLGRRGIFWEVATEEFRKYPHHTRQNVPWWLCRFFCRDVARAALEAPGIETQERVERFGRPAIAEQFDSLPLEDFQQELECRFVDESYSYFPYDLILPCTLDSVRLYDDFTDVPAPRGRLVAGFDVGRSHDRSELALFEQNDSVFTCRMLRSYDRVPFAEQEADVRRMLNTLPIARLSVDRSGIGMNMAENLVRDFPQVSGESFTSASKERWCTDFKILLQKRSVALPKSRELVGQIHSIKRRLLPSGNVSFEAERTNRGHADSFWAVVLACHLEREAGGCVGSVEARILG